MAESQASTQRSQLYDEELQDFQKLNKENRKNTLDRMYKEKYENRYDIYNMIQTQKLKELAKSRGNSPGSDSSMNPDGGEVNFMALTSE
jgi:hypothetical protein